MRKYKYILLSNDSGTRTSLINAPEGWDGQKVNVIRDFIYFGFLKSLSVEFEFVGDGYVFVRRQRLDYGIDANVIIRLYDEKNRFIFEGKINYENFRDDRKYNRFKVDIIQSSFVQKFQNRENIKLNVFNDIGLDRTAIEPAPIQLATVRGKEIDFFSRFSESDQPDEQYHFIWPFFLLENSNPDVQYVSNFELSDDVPSLYDIENAQIKNTTPTAQVYKIDWFVRYRLYYEGLPFGSAQRFFKMYRMSGNTILETFYEKFHTLSFSTGAGTFEDSFSQEITLQPNEYILFLSYRTTGTGFSDNSNMNVRRVMVDYEQMSLTATNPSSFPDTETEVILPHELFTNLVSQLTGEPQAFRSDFFGRVDLGYAQDGAGAYLAITKGELLRRIPFQNIEMSFSFRDAFVSYDSIFNLSIIITNSSIRIEPKDSTLLNELALQLGEVSELEITPIKEFIFNSVSAGFPEGEYEQENGRDEFNTTVQYTNSIQSVKKELKLVSVFRGDGYGIEFARRAPISLTGTKDTRYDNLIFFIDLIKEEGVLKSRRLEGIDYLTGVFSPETVINARISPGQNLLRWSKYLAVPLYKKEKTYFFQTKGKNANLQMGTALGVSNDREDLQLVQNAYFLPELRTFSASLSFENLLIILNNPFGLVAYTYKGEKFYDYLFEIDAETEKGNVEWKMIGTKPSPLKKDDEALLAAIKYDGGNTDLVVYDSHSDAILYE